MNNIGRPFSDLFLKCHDASVFADKNNHDVLSKVFYDDHNSEKVLESGNYFLIGEKGTGKTIIAQYLAHIRTDLNCSVVDYSVIDFDVFRRLIEAGKLQSLTFEQVWQLLLMTIAAEVVAPKEKNIFGFSRFQGMLNLINEFYNNRFTPDLSVALQMVEKIDEVAELSNKHLGKLSRGVKSELQQNVTVSESPLYKVLRDFTDAFISARVESDHIIFIDKIDIKPDDLEFDRFVRVLRAFSRAALFLNESVFGKMKGRRRIKFVLLMRPDIFDRLNLQNQSARATTNSVVLNWNTTYDHHRGSAIFALTDRFLGRQSGATFSPGGAWDRYVDANVYHDYHPEMIVNKSFREFLRISWFRPRDIIQSLYICQQQPECRDRVSREGFEQSSKDFSDYLFGEVKDFARFYFSDETFSLIERFFSEIGALRDLDYDSFRQAHQAFMKKLAASSVQRKIDDRIADPDEFLQILYSSNILCWRDENEFGGVDDYWAFRERTVNQLDPKVGLYARYAVHYGLRRAMRLRLMHVTAVRDQTL